MVYKNNCQGFIFVMTLFHSKYKYYIIILFRNYRMKLKLKLFIFEVAIHAVEHVRVITNICSNFLTDIDSNLTICLICAISHLFCFCLTNEIIRTMKRKFSFPYSALKYQLVFFQSEENHIDNICNITTYEIKILILHVLRICCLFILSVSCSDRIRVVGIGD